MHSRKVLAIGGLLAAVLTFNVVGQEAEKAEDTEKKQKLTDVVVTATKTLGRPLTTLARR